MRRVLAALALAAIGLAPVPATAQTTYKCAGKTATIVGTEGDDRSLYGTLGPDVMVGLAGHDLIFGSPQFQAHEEMANDTICGGDHRDIVYGRGGEDVLMGGADFDFASGGAGADRVSGGAGEDQVGGGSGHDWVQGGPDDDRVTDTGVGADQLYGNAGDDILDVTNRQSVPHKPDLVDGGDGFDTCYVDEEDQVENCEDVFVLA